MSDYCVSHIKGCNYTPRIFIWMLLNMYSIQNKHVSNRHQGICTLIPLPHKHWIGTKAKLDNSCAIGITRVQLTVLETNTPFLHCYIRNSCNCCFSITVLTHLHKPTSPELAILVCNEVCTRAIKGTNLLCTTQMTLKYQRNQPFSTQAVARRKTEL